jgi:uncharacterized protein
MNNRIQVRAIVGFIVLAFVPVWALWGILFLPGMANSLWRPLVLAAGMWGPGLAAILLTRFVLREPLQTTTIGRLCRSRYFLWAWLIPIAGTLAATCFTVLLRIADFDPNLTWLRSQIAAGGGEARLPMPLGILMLVQIIAALTIAPLINCLFALGEELGWRGFFLLRLMKAGLSQWQAMLLCGAIWGIWHAPAILLGHNYPAHPQLGVLLMTISCILLGIIFGWLQLASGSVWAPTLAHGTLNAVGGLPLLLLTPHDSAFGGIIVSMTGWIPLVLFIVWLAWTGRLSVQQCGCERSNEIT